METLSDVWPFVPGQQKEMFHAVGAAVIGLIVVNIFSALRQGLPFRVALSGLFRPVGTKNDLEKYTSAALTVCLVAGFFVLAIDVQVNGLQVMSLQELGKG